MKYDCIVGGAGPSGVVCAITLARLHHSVLLVEDTGVLGGTNILSLVGPLMSFHYKHQRLIGGIAQEIIKRLKEKQLSLGHIPDPLGFCGTVTPVDTEGLKAIYFEMIQESGVHLLLHTKIVHANSINNILKSITVCNKSGMYDIEASYFVDATGDGDICYSCGCSYTLKRSIDHLCQPMTMPFVVGNVDLNKVRKSMKEDPSNFVLAKDYSYDYVGVSGFFKEVQLAKQNNDFPIERDRVLFFQNVRKNEVTINMTRVIQKVGTNANDLTEAELMGRNQIQIVYQFLRKYIPGFENCEIVSTPQQIGIRETRHITTDYIMTKEDILNHSTFKDTVVVGSYPMDIHSPNGCNLDANPLLDIYYEIPSRTLIPVGIDNLLVSGRAIGATHEASASMRVTPIVMAIGEACGVIIAKCIEENSNTRNVNIQSVQDQLLNMDCILHINH